MAKPPEDIYIIGAGGHGKVAVRVAQAAGMCVAAVFDDDPAKWNSELFGVPIVGPVDAILRRSPLPTLLAIGDNVRRLALADSLNLPWISLVHPAAYVDESVEVGAGVLVLPGAVVNADAAIGDYAIVNSNATIEHDCQVGAGAHISCCACLTGGVQVGRGALIGAGAVVLPGVTVSPFAQVGAGAVVTRYVAPAATVAGVPARILRSSKLHTA